MRQMKPKLVPTGLELPGCVAPVPMFPLSLTPDAQYEKE